MARKKKEVVVIDESSMEDESTLISEEIEETKVEEKPVQKVEENKNTLEKEKLDDDLTIEGKPIDVPIDESFYKPTTVNVKQIVEDGTYKITQVDLKRKKADLDFGLDSLDVLARETAHWDNVNDKKGTRTVSGIVLSKIFTIFNLLCFGVAAWLISVGAFTKCFFVIIVTANIIIGIVQDLRAKAMIDKLSILSAPTVLVLRDGEQQEIEVKSIVVDDIMILTNGKQICSDSVVIEGFIEVNESLLTGESDPIVKKPGDTLYSGSFVVSGICKARVEKVGEEKRQTRLVFNAW